MRGRWLQAGEILKAVLERKGLRDAMRRHEAVEGWEEAVGRRVAEKARPSALRGKTLFVDVEGSAWIHELTFFRAEILRKLNERIDGGGIERLVFLARGRKIDEPAPSGHRKKRDHEDG